MDHGHGNRDGRIARPHGEAADLDTALRTHFGLPAFRPLQKEIITTVMAGQPVLAVLPTGGGKSLCYQLPALVLPGTALVISPLISLMKDQVDGLVARGIRAIAINSQDTTWEGETKLEALVDGAVQLVFVAPERLRSLAFQAACRSSRISLLAVDEAHCVSQWGHDFRPDYRYIRDFHAAIGAPPLLALTATARPDVRRDVMQHLGIAGAQVFAASANRANLWLGLESCTSVAEKRAKVTALAAQSGGSTIIYVSSRKDAEGLAAALSAELHEPVACYHAGLPASERTAVQNQFMAGLTRVVTATNAFGMGIDKPDIRAVIHAGVPESVEAYFQEVGRAGRDGATAACTMVLVAGLDLKLREFLLNKERTDGPTADAVCRRVQELSRQGGGTLVMDQESDALTLLVVSHLQDMGALDVVRRDRERCELRIPSPLPETALARVRSALHEHEQRRQERFRRMRIFIYLKDQCRRDYVLRYFGERLQARPEACCSTCHPRPLAVSVTPQTKRRQGQTLAGSQPQAGPHEAEPHPQAGLILEQLKRWRRVKAADLAVPAYVVFGDRDLSGIAAAAPRTLAELAACRGVGPVKLQQYGAEVLREIVAALAATDTASAGAADARRQAAPISARFARGETVAAVAAALGQPEPAIWDEFLSWILAEETDAWKAAVRKVISPEDYVAIRRALGPGDGRLPQFVFAGLDGRYSLDQIRVARAVLLRSRRRG